MVFVNLLDLVSGELSVHPRPYPARGVIYLHPIKPGPGPVERRSTAVGVLRVHYALARSRRSGSLATASSSRRMLSRAENGGAGAGSPAWARGCGGSYSARAS